jgi:putative nucleotidyltransferase with HDIG domain
LKAICEEIAQALNTPAATVLLLDQKKDVLFTAAGMGIASDLSRSIVPLSRTTYNKIVAQFGKVFALADLQDFPSLPFIKEFKRLNFQSFAFAAMEYENELIGSLNAVTIGEKREFSEDELLLLQGMAQQAALAIINTRLYKDAHRRLENLQALRSIDIAITTNHDLQETLNVLLDQITNQLRVDAAVILLLDETKQQLEFGTSRGFQTSTLRYTSLRIGEGMAGRAAQQHQVVHIHDLRVDPQTLIKAAALAKEGFVSYYAAPLISQGKVKGVLEIFHRTLLEPDKEWLNFLEALSGQAAIAIESTTLFQDLKRTNDELSQAYDSTIEGWSHALDLRDKETEGHTRRVTELTLELAQAFGFSDAELIHIRRGALLHDIGKMGVPDKILLKEGALTPEEWDIMRQHPVYAHEMLLPIDYLRPALDIPYSHHEKWDGTGYPLGLKENGIPLIARIFAVVDVWDALTSDRPYREAWASEKVLAHIQQGAGQHFDPRVVEIFVDFMKRNSKAGNK